MCKVERFILYGSLGVLLVLALIFDYKFSVAVYDPSNWFGRIFELIGEVPMWFVGSFIAFILAFYHPRFKTNWKNRVVTIFFIAAAFGVGVYGGHHTLKLASRIMFLNLSSMKTWVFGLIVAVPIVGLGFLAARKIKKENTKEAYLFALFVLITIAASLLIMQAFKMIWLRPRYRTLAALQEVGAINSIQDYWKAVYQPQFFTSFKNYQAGGALGFSAEQIQAAMVKLGVTKWEMEEFYSFPSGHTMNTFVAITLCYLPRLYPRLSLRYGFSLLWRCIIYAFVAIVAFSRIMRGAHNLTDVVIAYILAAVLFDLMSTLFYEKFLRRRYLQKVETIPANL